MKKTITITAIVMAAIMTAVVGFRLSTDALSIIVGAILGMIAVLPTIALVAFLLKKNQEAMVQPQQGFQQPPVVVVSGGMMPPQYLQPQQQPTQTQPGVLPPPSRSMPRKFHLMGYEDTERLEISDEEWAAAG